MKNITIKENYLEAIRFGTPDHVPLSNEYHTQSFILRNNLRQENWTDCWGVRWEVSSGELVPFPKGNPITDIERIEEYKFPEVDDIVDNDEVISQIKLIDRSEYFVCGMYAYLLYERAWALMGMEEFMMALITNPEECKVLLHGIATVVRKVMDRYMELGIDSVFFSEDLGSQRALMFSPDIFRELFIPEYKYAFENLKKEGKMINFHSCGCIDAVAGDIASVGVTLLNPIQALANDLKKVKADTVGHMALNGGIDTATILTGKPADVEKEVIRVMEILKPRGGYVCGPDQHFPNFPEENINTLYRVAAELGKY